MYLKQKWQSYETQFRENDDEFFKTDISNDDAYSFLLEQMPLIDIPDKVIERTYYFRYWTYRKHIKNTPYGHIITEFLPDVPWAGACNSINCATPFHLMEGRWLKDAAVFLGEYIDFFLNEIGNPYSYSMPFIASVSDYADITAQESFLDARYDKLKTWHETRLAKTKKVCGLYYSIDDRDGMEFGISGSGLRPTINSYIYADTKALAKLAKRIGNPEDAQKYNSFANTLRDTMFQKMWKEDFYLTIPESVMEDLNNPEMTIPLVHNAKELIGYIPWIYGLADQTQNNAWKYLMDTSCFYTNYGLTTVDQSHPRYMEKHDHECLWNGPIWPYATSQVLTAVARGKQTIESFPITNEEYCSLLHIYATSHKRITSEGKTIDWIDENLSPYDGSWISRDILEQLGFPASKGGYERGKDYNHSLFCDLVLSGILGIGMENDKLSVKPLIPKSWDYFKVENLHFREKQYSITYDRNGSHYNGKKGIEIIELHEKGGQTL